MYTRYHYSLPQTRCDDAPLPCCPCSVCLIEDDPPMRELPFITGCVENQARQWFALFSGSPALSPAGWLLLGLAVCYVFVCLLCLLFHLFSWLSGPSCLGLERLRSWSDGPLPCSLTSLPCGWQSERKGNGEFRSHSPRGNARDAVS